MYGDRRIDEFTDGLRSFLNVAEANTRNGFMCCPCKLCRNEKDYSSSQTLHVHLLQYGFMHNYNCWTKHGERGVMMEGNEDEDDDDNYPMSSLEYGYTGRGEAEHEEALEEPVLDDDLRRVIVDVQRETEDPNEKLKQQRMLEDHKKLLYPNCEDPNNTKLGTMGGANSRRPGAAARAQPEHLH